MRDPKDSYIKLFRKIIGHPIVWDFPFNKFQAWEWMKMVACYQPDGFLERGQLIAGRRYLAKKWGWSEAKVWRFLQSLRDNAMISTKVVRRTDSILKVCSKYDFFDTNIRADLRTDKIPTLTIITIVNYNTYQTSKQHDGNGHETDSRTDPRTDGWTDSRTDSETVLKEQERNKEIKEIKNRTVRSQKPRACHDAEQLTEKLSAINITDFIRQFEPKGLDVLAVWDKFQDEVLEGNEKDNRPNPRNYIDFKKAFRKWCELNLERGWRLLKTAKQKTLEQELEDIANKQCV